MDLIDTLFSFFEFLGEVDFALVFSVFGIGFGIFWLVVIGWAWNDAVNRYKSKGVAILIVILLLVFNIFGLFIYLIVRPRFTTEEEYWDGLERRFLKYEAQGLGDCPNCGAEVQPSYIHCPECGKKLRVKCKSCDMYLERSWKVCPFCGERRREDKKAEVKEIKKMKSSNIKTGPNKKILMWGKKIDKFVRDIGAWYNNLVFGPNQEKKVKGSDAKKITSEDGNKSKKK